VVSWPFLVIFLVIFSPLTLNGSSMEDLVELLQLHGDVGLIIVLLWLCCLNIFQCLKLELKSDLDSEFFFSKLLEGLMSIVVFSTFLTKYSLCSHLNSIHWLKLVVALTSLCISCLALFWTSFIYWVLSIDLHPYKTNIHQKLWWVLVLSSRNMRVTFSANNLQINPLGILN
jgi:hypothetical protein